MAPAVGQPFPSIVLEGAKYEKVRIPEDFRGRTVVLSWFPVAFSPTCTEELTNFARIHTEFNGLGATVVGASNDHWYTNVAYQASLGAPFPILSDWFRTEARKAAVFDEQRQRPFRVIQILDKQGVLRWEKRYGADTCPEAAEFMPVLEKLA